MKCDVTCDADVASAHCHDPCDELFVGLVSMAWELQEWGGTKAR